MEEVKFSQTLAAVLKNNTELVMLEQFIQNCLVSLKQA